MMTVRLICIGKLKEKYLSDACKEYQKRLGAFCKLELLELPELSHQKLSKGLRILPPSPLQSLSGSMYSTIQQPEPLSLLTP